MRDSRCGEKLRAKRSLVGGRLAIVDGEVLDAIIKDGCICRRVDWLSLERNPSMGVHYIVDRRGKYFRE